MHVIFEQESASLRQFLVQIRRDERLKILTAPQPGRAKFGSGRLSERTSNAIASLEDHLVVHSFVANFRK
jgi:hypothetical protein